jgi:chromosome partitioning protein
MRVIAIYNNKGGVGKSTLTVGLAELLAGNRKRSVLVIDLDAQGSSSGSLLGRGEVAKAIDAHRTIARLAEQLFQTGKPPSNLPAFIVERPAAEVRARVMGLKSIGVLVPDKPNMFDLEETRMKPDQSLLVLRDLLKPALGRYEYVLVDLPANIDPRNRLAFSALIMSDFVLIPVEPSEISLHALPDTFDMIHKARMKGAKGKPSVLGLVLNKTDKRTEQYRTKFQPILESSGRGELPRVFDNFLPDTPSLASATDGTEEFSTLKERFETYYDHVRKVAVELDEQCQRSPLEPSPDNVGNASGILKRLFDSLIRRKKKRPEREGAAV